MTEATLRAWDHFHDWYLDRIDVGPNQEPRTLALGLYLRDDRATVVFEGVTCCSLENFGLLNIVYSLRIVDSTDKNYDRAIAILNKGERLSERKAPQVAFVYSTLGAELAIEFDSLRVVRSGGA
jgi:hypothetical protein